ncbi:hypothetical protein KM043_013956 [Ampulex compressa]|nr:hypothetical protein KM043_013956 [Ampulex compressa]
METVRPCGCKGIRSCLICETEYNIVKPDLNSDLEKAKAYVYCPYCDKSWPGWNSEQYKDHPYHTSNPINYPGVYIKLDFLSLKEASSLMNDLDTLTWEPSQSGRRKQNFGPKCNFKKRKLRLGTFSGFPRCTQFVQEKFSEISLLDGFRTIEQCTLEYNPERGASIDPHIDDCWIWGERIVTVNVIGDSILTMTPYHGSDSRYNLQSVTCNSSGFNEEVCMDNNASVESLKDVIVRIPMPARSLLILYGPARYKWEHSILRQDITERSSIFWGPSRTRNMIVVMSSSRHQLVKIYELHD